MAPPAVTGAQAAGAADLAQAAGAADLAQAPSTADFAQAPSTARTWLLVPILLLFVLLIIAVLRAPSLISNVGIGSAIIVSAPLILATYSLTLIAMAGRAGVDLSIGPLIGFINVSLIQLYAADLIASPFAFFAYAIIVGILYQVLMGLIIVYVRVQPIIVALSGYLALVGLNLVILPRPGGVAPEWMMPWGLGTSIWSPVLAILVLATGAWFLLARTAFFDHLRLMGSDERTAYTAGVRINIVRLGAHVVAGVYGALAALTFTALISSGDPTQGTTYTLMAVTALVLGGTSLAGGRGSIIGSLLGALNIYLITYVLSTFNFGMVQSFVTDAAYGVVLVVSLLLTLALPRLPAAVRRISPFAFFVVLGIVAFSVLLHARDEVVAPVAAPGDGGLTVLGGDDSGLTVLGGDDSGLTVLGGDESGLTVLGGDDSGLTVLGGDDSGLTILGGEEPAAPAVPAARATPLVYAALTIVIAVFLVYLLYRHPSVSLFAFVGVLLLLILGLSLHEGRGPAATAGTPADPAGATPFVFYLEAPAPAPPSAGVHDANPDGSHPAAPAVRGLLLLTGTVMLASLLIVVALPRVRTHLANTHLLLLLASGGAALVILLYASGGAEILPGGLYVEAYGAVLLGAILLIASMPRVQPRVKDLSFVLLSILGGALLVATWFAAGPESAVEAVAAGGAPAAAPAPRPPPLGPAALSDAFYGAVFWVLLAAGAIFLVTLPRAGARIRAYIALDTSVKAVSYTGGFIVIAAVLALGAMFHAASLPLWKLGVAIVAAMVVGRYAWRFLRRYRGGEPLSSAHPGPRLRRGVHAPAGAER